MSKVVINWKALQEHMGLPKWVNSREDLQKLIRMKEKGIETCPHCDKDITK